MRCLLIGVLILGLESTVFAYDAKQVVLVDVSIENAVFESNTRDRKRWEVEVRDQLHFLVSQLRPYRATPALFHTLSIEIKKVAKGNHATNRVEYSAKLLASWRRDQGFPVSLSVVLPLRADAEGLSAFEKNYGELCGHAPLWYYYTPTKPGCVLANQTPDDAQRIVIDANVSEVNTSGKYPEYEKIWEDGRLVITHVMGNTKARSNGEAADDELHRNIAQEYSNVRHTETDNFSHVTQTSTFYTGAGQVQLRTMRILDGNVQGVNEKFRNQFTDYQKDSDVISYNGHAGLGENVRAFLRMVRPAPGKYSILWINACVPFAYFDDSAIDAFKIANPGVAWSKYLDMLIVSEVGTFAEVKDIQDLIRTLPTKALRFTELTPSMMNYAPVVIGEEDNAWPKPF